MLHKQENFIVARRKKTTMQFPKNEVDMKMQVDGKSGGKPSLSTYVKSKVY